MILGKIVELKNIKKEKYGRILAEVWYKSMNISTWLLNKRLAVKYDGKKKISPENWMKYYKG